MTATEPTNEERLQVYLADQYYSHPNGGGADVGRRFASGDLKIEIGESNWPKGWYSDPYFNVSVPFALELAQRLPTVKVFKLYYWGKQDFHHVEFECDGETYIVQWYKIFTIYRKSDGMKHYSDGRYSIPGWFGRGRHKTSEHWHDAGKTFNPFDPECKVLT